MAGPSASYEAALEEQKAVGMTKKEEELEVEVLPPTHDIHGNPIKPLVVVQGKLVPKEEQLEKQLVQLRRAFRDLWNRVTFTEKRISAQEQKQLEQMWFIPQQNDELVPAPSDLNKLPVRYSDKSFPYISLPLVKAMFFARKVFRRASSYVLMPEVSVEGTRKAIAEADEERQLINVLKIQRRIHKVQRALMQAIRKNFDSMIEDIGSFTNDNVVIAHVLKSHFEEVGYNSVKITTNSDRIYLMIEIEY